MKQIIKTLLAGVVLAGLIQTAAQAQILPGLTGPGTNGNQGAQDLTIGFVFSLDSSQPLDALGFFDEGSALVNGAYKTSHEVGLWDRSTGTQLADATVSFIPTAAGSGTAVYSSSITDLNGFTGTLAAGTSYIIAVQTLGLDNLIDHPTAPPTSPGVTLVFSIYGGGNTGQSGVLVLPNNPDAPSEAYVGPNFLFGTATPEPSTYALLGAGVLVLILMQRRKAFFR